MYDFLAMRIHDGKLTWEAVSKLKASAVKRVREAYARLYPDEETPA